MTNTETFEQMEAARVARVVAQDEAHCAERARQDAWVASWKAAGTVVGHTTIFDADFVWVNHGSVKGAQ